MKQSLNRGEPSDLMRDQPGSGQRKHCQLPDAPSSPPSVRRRPHIDAPTLPWIRSPGARPRGQPSTAWLFPPLLLTPGLCPRLIVCQQDHFAGAFMALTAVPPSYDSPPQRSSAPSAPLRAPTDCADQGRGPPGELRFRRRSRWGHCCRPGREVEMRKLSSQGREGRRNA